MSKKTSVQMLRSHHWLLSTSMSTTEKSYSYVWKHMLYLQLWAFRTNVTGVRTSQKRKIQKLGHFPALGPTLVQSNYCGTVVYTWCRQWPHKKYKFKKK